MNIQLHKEEVRVSQNGGGFKRIFRNFSGLTLGKIGGDFFNFFLFVFLSREFGQQGIGQYSFAFGFTGLFSILADFGLYNYSIKEISISKNKFEQSYLGIFSLRLILSTLLLLLLFAIIPFLNFSFESKLIIAIIGTHQIIYVLIDGLGAIFVGHEFMFAAGLIAASSRTMTSLTSIIIVLLTGNLVFSLLSFPIMSILQFIVLIYIVKKRFGSLKVTFSTRILIETFKNVLPYGIKTFLSMIFIRCDVILIGFLLGEVAVGLYNVGYRVIFFLLFIPNFTAVSIFPIISKMFRTSKSEFQKMYNKSLNMMVVIALPISAGLWLISSKLIELVFGQDFSESAQVLRILSGIFLLNSIGSIMEFFLISSDKQNEYAKSQFVATVFSIIVNLVLIHFYGIEGAAVAVLSAYFLLAVMYGIRLKNVVGLPNIKSRLFISLLGIVAFCIPMSFFSNLSIFIIIPLSTLIYLGTLIVFKDIRNNELRMFLSLIGIKRNGTESII